MVDYHTNLVNALNTVLPTHYEMALTSGTTTPCISYMETNNYAQSNGDTLGYSVITYQVKIWGEGIGTIQSYIEPIDEIMREQGWKRIASGELFDNQSSMVQKILTYQALFKEEF